MSEFASAVNDFWSHSFSGEVIYNRDSFALTVNSGLPADRRVMLLETADGGARAVLMPELVDRLKLREHPDLSASAFRQIVADAGITFYGADYLFYFSEGDKDVLLGASLDAGRSVSVIPSGRRRSRMESRDQPFQGKRSQGQGTIDPSTAGPRPSARDDGNPERSSGASVRRLTEADRAAFAGFEKAASEDDLDAAYVELDHWAVFGAFEQNRLVCVASMYPWGDSQLADLGVLTLPDFRGRGYARRVVRAICKYAVEQGYEPQYRCQLDHLASKALAERSGLTLFGTWDVVASNAPTN